MIVPPFGFAELALELNLFYSGHKTGGGEPKLMIDSSFNDFLSLHNTLINFFHFKHMWKLYEYLRDFNYFMNLNSRNNYFIRGIIKRFIQKYQKQSVPEAKNFAAEIWIVVLGFSFEVDEETVVVEDFFYEVKHVFKF